MKDIETLLTAPAYGAPAERAARRFATHAADSGLLDIAYCEVESPVGTLLMAATRRGLVRLAFDTESAEQVLADLARHISPRILEAPARLDGARRELTQYFDGRRHAFELEVDWSLIHGFGRAVLRNTARIPYGEVSTYGDIARRAGSPRASRATGNALGSNPIAIVIPCHRVVRTGGGLGGYGGGLDRKEVLLKLEGALGGRRSPGAPPTG
jgi:methylated-DNA-[protein]-cysteine S-methyltransferase